MNSKSFNKVICTIARLVAMMDTRQLDLVIQVAQRARNIRTVKTRLLEISMLPVPKFDLNAEGTRLLAIKRYRRENPHVSSKAAKRVIEFYWD